MNVCFFRLEKNILGEICGPVFDKLLKVFFRNTDVDVIVERNMSIVANGAQQGPSVQPVSYTVFFSDEIEDS